MTTQYPKVKDFDYWIHRIDPLSLSVSHYAGGSNSLRYAIARCKSLAEKHKGQDYLLMFRVLKHRGDVVFLSLVNFDTVDHWDMREKETEA